MSYKRWVLVATILFGIGIVLGLNTPAVITGLLSREISALREFAGIIVPFSFLTFIIIFFKNITSLLVSFILSPVLCLMPVLSLVLNGWILAFVSVLVAREESLGFVFAGLAPHGIFELPAFIMGQAAALSSGTMIMLALFKKERTKLLLPGLKNNLRYLIIAIALLLPAAIIETYITPLLLT